MKYLNQKALIKKIAAKHQIIIKKYHSDNGRFGERTFHEACEMQGQPISFCGVGAHHQNRIAENWIKKLTLKSRTMLLHAKRHWPEYITTLLWQYALKAAEAYCNQFDVYKDGISPEEKFSNVCAVRSLEGEHTWG